MIPRPDRRIEGLPLELLDIGRTHVSNLSLLREMKLKSLSIVQTRVTDLTPLKGMPLESR